MKILETIKERLLEIKQVEREIPISDSVFVLVENVRKLERLNRLLHGSYISKLSVKEFENVISLIREQRLETRKMIEQIKRSS